MSDHMIMEDVLLSEGAFSLTDDLEELFPEDILAKSEAKMAKSPGHFSVTSMDSGLGHASPHRSLPDMDSNVISLQDLIEEEGEDASYMPLNAYMVGTEALDVNMLGLGSSQAEGPSSPPQNQAMETSGSNLDDVSTDDVFSIPDTDLTNHEDLRLLLNCVSTNSPSQLEPVGSDINQQINVSETSRSGRPVRATKSGKTVVMSSNENSDHSPSGRVTRSKSRPTRRPKQSREELENINIEEVDKSQKNAIQARINRQKKKVYIEGLEEQVEALSKENEVLKRDSKKYQKERDSLEEELKYYKKVLANDSQLAGLLANIGNVGNVRLTTSFETSRKRGLTHDHDYGQGPSSKKRKAQTEETMSGGVCLHVDKDTVSLEFCSKCSKMANGAGQETHQS